MVEEGAVKLEENRSRVGKVVNMMFVDSRIGPDSD